MQSTLDYNIQVYKVMFVYGQYKYYMLRIIQVDIMKNCELCFIYRPSDLSI